jgi:hypothetical protein
MELEYMVNRSSKKEIGEGHAYQAHSASPGMYSPEAIAMSPACQRLPITRCQQDVLKHHRQESLSAKGKCQPEVVLGLLIYVWGHVVRGVVGLYCSRGWLKRAKEEEIGQFGDARRYRFRE